MEITDTGFEGLKIITPRLFEDDRGYFMETWREEIFDRNNLSYHFVQDNEAKSSYGVIRGLHYQLPPFGQAKLIRVIHGTILDAVVDIRPDSMTYGKVFTIELSGENRKQLLIPRGFAHGYSCLSENAVFLYKCDNTYAPSHEGHLLYNDLSLAIDWKIPEHLRIVSEKDQKGKKFGEHLTYE